MKITTLAALAVTGAASAVTFLGAAPAHADSSDLIAWARSVGFTGTDSAISVRGSLVCADIMQGADGEQAAHDLWDNTDITDLNSARIFVIHAVDELCPEYDHRGTPIAPTTMVDPFGPHVA